jgi:hypothetical protein
MRDINAQLNDPNSDRGKHLLPEQLQGVLKRAKEIGKEDQVPEMIVSNIAGGRGKEGASQRVRSQIGAQVMRLTHSYEERRDWGKSCNMITCLILLALS